MECGVNLDNNDYNNLKVIIGSKRSSDGSCFLVMDRVCWGREVIDGEYSIVGLVLRN